MGILTDTDHFGDTANTAWEQISKSEIAVACTQRTFGATLLFFIYALLFLVLSGAAAWAGTVNCKNTARDAMELQRAINRGGTVNLTGTCSLGTSQININKAATLVGPATMVASPSFDDWTFIENVDDVTFNKLTFTNTGIHVTGSNDTKRNHVNFTGCTFQHFNAPTHHVSKYAVIAIDPIWRNSTYNHNAMTDVWLGGWSNTTIANASAQNGSTSDAYDSHGLFVGAGLDNSQVEYNTFSEISGNAIKVFGNGLSSNALGYTASGVSISYNTFTFIHRMGIEIQNMTSQGACTGGCNGFALNYLNIKIAGNFFYHPAYIYWNTYAYSLPVMGTGHQIINNSAVQDVVGNPAAPQARSGYAFEEPPGTGCCGTKIWNGSAKIRGNVISGDPNPADAQNPGWYAAFVNYGSASPQYHQNNVMCGPKWNHVISNSPNEIDQYNYKRDSCTPDAGATLYGSNLKVVWTSADHQSLRAGGHCTWSAAVVSNLSIRYVEFFVDNTKEPMATQELQDLNQNFEKDRRWLYHAAIDTSSLTTGKHVISAQATDVAGVSQRTDLTFTIGGVK